MRAWVVLIPLLSLFAYEGVEYAHFETGRVLEGVEGPQSVHVIEVDPAVCVVKPARALDDGVGRESVLSMSARHGAIAAVNGGFFTIGGTFDGKACGALKIGAWIALPVKPRGCIGWSSEEQSPKMDRLLVRVGVDDGSRHLQVDGLNRPRREGEMVLFTPCFHRTTLTTPDGEEVVVVNGVIEAVQRGGSAKIPVDGFVLSIQAKHPLFHTFHVGERLAVSTEIRPLTGATSSDEWEELDYIVGGTPLLLRGGIKIGDFESEQTIPSFLSKKHARSAVGVLPSGHWLLVVVDKNDQCAGMTIDELAGVMARLGCVDALNLDGGGSSTLVYEGAVKNHPCGDEDEGAGQETVRRVSDAILVIPKNLSQ
jgi:hypothetical protein